MFELLYWLVKSDDILVLKLTLVALHSLLGIRLHSIVASSVQTCELKIEKKGRDNYSIIGFCSRGYSTLRLQLAACKLCVRMHPFACNLPQHKGARCSSDILPEERKSGELRFSFDSRDTLSVASLIYCSIDSPVLVLAKRRRQIFAPLAASLQYG